MSDERKSAGVQIVVVAALLLALLCGGYVAGYFTLGEFCLLAQPVEPHQSPFSPFLARVFPHRHLATIYAPLGKVESWWRGEEVSLGPPWNF
jgi:hypothetical protein